MITATSPQSPAPRKGDWMQTRSGKMFYALDPQPGDILIEDIAHALSMLCRFGGHCNEFYSVAQHSVHVSELLPHHLKLSGLLHDATEAYLVDIPRPIKSALPEYKVIESRLAEVIEHALQPHVLEPLQFEHPAVKAVDNIMLMTEARDLLNKHPAPWGLAHVIPDPTPVVAWPQQLAESRFITAYLDLVRAAQKRGHAAFQDEDDQ